MAHTYYKDPDEVLDYKFDWAPLTNQREGGISDWLRAGETIVSHIITADAGISIDSTAQADANTSVVAWASGGIAGTRYLVSCRITTNQNRTGERSIYITVLQR